MMTAAVRKIVHIDEDKCDGCGLCVPACHEGAIKITDGKAKLLADNLCDGLGDCLGHCPQDAITIEERKADDFDKEAVQKHLRTMNAPTVPAGCPGSRVMSRNDGPAKASPVGEDRESQLRQWPIQLALVPSTAPYFNDADILLAADCVPFAYPDFHHKLLRGRAVAIGCPKLDNVGAYVEKIAAILRENHVRSLGVAYMEVPCCTGLIRAAEEAMRQSGKNVPFWTMKLGVDGEIKES